MVLFRAHFFLNKGVQCTFMILNFWLPGLLNRWLSGPRGLPAHHTKKTNHSTSCCWVFTFIKLRQNLRLYEAL
jgi:hypothetical protein